MNLESIMRKLLELQIEQTSLLRQLVENFSTTKLDLDCETYTTPSDTPNPVTAVVQPFSIENINIDTIDENNKKLQEQERQTYLQIGRDIGEEPVIDAIRKPGAGKYMTLGDVEEMGNRHVTFNRATLEVEGKILNYFNHIIGMSIEEAEVEVAKEGYELFYLERAVKTKPKIYYKRSGLESMNDCECKPYIVFNNQILVKYRGNRLVVKANLEDKISELVSLGEIKESYLERLEKSKSRKFDECDLKLKSDSDYYCGVEEGELCDTEGCKQRNNN